MLEIVRAGFIQTKRQHTDNTEMYVERISAAIDYARQYRVIVKFYIGIQAYEYNPDNGRLVEITND